jgi:uncharacterized protein YjbI with pentapeptide repeats
MKERDGMSTVSSSGNVAPSDAYRLVVIRKGVPMIRILRSLRTGMRTRVALAITLVLAIGALVYSDATFWNWRYSGFGPKTVWDWLDLLLVPAILAGGGFWFSWYQKQYELQLQEQRAREDHKLATERAQAERDLVADASREAALQAYINHMAELLLTRNLRDSQPGEQVRAVARARTLTVLRTLDDHRKGSLIHFLYESGLISKNTMVIDLHHADLSNAHAAILVKDHHDERSTSGLRVVLRDSDLSGAILTKAQLSMGDLSGSNLRDAHMDGATFVYTNLRNADMRKARLVEAGLIGTSLQDANLEGANMTGAFVYSADFRGARLHGASLWRAAFGDGSMPPKFEGARYNHATRWPDDFEPQAAGAILEP